ncbi:MAG TPA: metal-dependent hydrolase [Helicobacteraceae bacterium]|nr:metal-dependent hydrolase [Helicobacteraceae bacterium]
MKLIYPDFILTPEGLLEQHAIAFEKTIVAIAPLDEVRKQFPDAEYIKLPVGSLVMPGLINTHVHLEFSANKTALHYGSFMPWLHSVIDQRATLVGECSTETMEKATQKMLRSGTTTFATVSSNGLDLTACEKAPQNVIFFNELIGSQAVMADALFGDFKERLAASDSVTREGFQSAIAIHSPYSVHPILIEKAIQIAKSRNLPLSAHYLESNAEREWLDNSEGEFKPFFKNLIGQDKAVNSAGEFLNLFDNHPTLMTHVIKANDNELQQLADKGHTVIHCPISNRLLGNGAINLDALDNHNINWLCATDGLSSNYKLDLFEEMKIALFMHSETPLLPLAQSLIESVTSRAAKALNLNKGSIEVGKDADMLVLTLDEEPNEQLALHLLLHNYPIDSLFINGKHHTLEH